MLAPSSSSASFARQSGAGETLLVVVARSSDTHASTFATSLQARVSAGLDGRPVTVLVATAPPEVTLVGPDNLRVATGSSLPAVLAAGGTPGSRGALGALLREADSRGSAAAALVTGGIRDDGIDWLRLLFSPILEDGFEFVCPSYRRARLDGLLGTAILYPLTRALYGVRLRQPAGGEAAISLGLARHLLADTDWRRGPDDVGSDAWVVGKVLSERRRACQAWLGRWPGDGSPEDASHALARLVGPVFREMERRADRWQRVDGSEPVPSFGAPGTLAEEPIRVDVADLASKFRLGLRELDGVWGLVLPPATRLALRRAAAAPPDALRLDDILWARVVYDFAVAHYIRTMERGQLLRSLTPLYLGWVAGFVNDVQALDGAGTEARVDALCAAFEQEKRYLIGRWRWPDSFNP